MKYAKGEGAILSRRQEMPDDAFIGLDDLMAAIEPQVSCTAHALHTHCTRHARVLAHAMHALMHTPCACQDNGLRIIVLSYGWTTPQHPDPLGATLLRVANVLQHYVGTHGAP